MRVVPLLLGVSLLAACAEDTATDVCDEGVQLGEFETSTDLFLAHFDIKTDVDDLHAAAAVATFLKSEAFQCVRHIAVAGTYGIQEGPFVAAPELFERAYGENWRDAHTRREEALSDVAGAVAETLERGGDVWIMEGGQSDFTHDVLSAVAQARGGADFASSVHVVQHSDWNESVTTPEKLSAVQAMTDYRKIADGNASDNGTPNYNSPSRENWQRVIADPVVGGFWRIAKEVGEEKNGVGYVNPSVTAGGFDFSDTAEASHIFGFQDQADIDAFFDAFLSADG